MGYDQRLIWMWQKTSTMYVLGLTIVSDTIRRDEKGQYGYAALFGRRTSEGVILTISKHFYDSRERKRITGVWIKYRQGILIFTRYFRRTGVGLVRNEVLMKVVLRSMLNTRSQSFIDYDVIMESIQFRFGKKKKYWSRIEDEDV